METGFGKGERVIGFHGAGGGGSMMNMDALFARGFDALRDVGTALSLEVLEFRRETVVCVLRQEAGGGGGLAHGLLLAVLSGLARSPARKNKAKTLRCPPAAVRVSAQVKPPF